MILLEILQTPRAVYTKTLLTTFFVVEGKGAYSLLLERDWIHANCCIPSTMHQQLVQWVDDDIEVVQADDSVSMANMEPPFWEYQGIDCFSGKEWGEGPIEPVSSRSGARPNGPKQGAGCRWIHGWFFPKTLGSCEG
jgi:hypothetical protein